MLSVNFTTLTQRKKNNNFICFLYFIKYSQNAEIFGINLKILVLHIGHFLNQFYVGKTNYV
jgi:hypothetical protein